MSRYKESPNIVIIPKESVCDNKPVSNKVSIILPPGKNNVDQANIKDTNFVNANNLKNIPENNEYVSSALIPLKHIPVNLLPLSYSKLNTTENTHVLHNTPNNLMSEGNNNVLDNTTNTPVEQYQFGNLSSVQNVSKNTIQPHVEQMPYSAWMFEQNIPINGPMNTYPQQYSHYNLLPEGNTPINNGIEQYSYPNLMPRENIHLNNINDTYVVPQYLSGNVLSQANVYVNNTHVDQYTCYSLKPQQQIPVNNTVYSQIEQYPCCNLMSNIPNNTFMDASSDFLSAGNIAAQAYMNIARSEVASENSQCRDNETLRDIKERIPVKTITNKEESKRTSSARDRNTIYYRKKKTENIQHKANKKAIDQKEKDQIVSGTSQKIRTEHAVMDISRNDREVKFHEKADDKIKHSENTFNKTCYTVQDNKTDRTDKGTDKVNKENVKGTKTQTKINTITEKQGVQKTILKSKNRKSITNGKETRTKTKKVTKDLQPSTSRANKILQLKREIEKIERVQKYLKTSVDKIKTKQSNVKLTQIDSSITNLKTKVQQQVDMLNLSLDEYIQLQKYKESNPLKSVVQVPRKDDVHRQKKSHDDIDLRTTLSRKRTRNECYSRLLQEKHRESENLLVTIQQDVNADTQYPLSVEKKTKTKKSKKIKLVINVVCDESTSSESENDTECCPPPSNDLSFLDDFNVDEIVDSLNFNHLADNKEIKDFSITPNDNDNSTFKSVFENNIPDISNNFTKNIPIIKSEPCKEHIDEPNQDEMKRFLLKSEVDNNIDHVDVDNTENKSTQVNSIIMQNEMHAQSEILIERCHKYEDSEGKTVERNSLDMTEENENRIDQIKNKSLEFNTIKGSVEDGSLKESYDADSCDRMMNYDFDSKIRTVESELNSDTEKQSIRSMNKPRYEHHENSKGIDEIIVISDDESIIINDDCIYVGENYENNYKNKIENHKQSGNIKDKGENKTEMCMSDKSFVKTMNEKQTWINAIVMSDSIEEQEEREEIHIKCDISHQLNTKIKHEIFDTITTNNNEISNGDKKKDKELKKKSENLDEAIVTDYTGIRGKEYKTDKGPKETYIEYDILNKSSVGEVTKVYKKDKSPKKINTKNDNPNDPVPIYDENIDMILITNDDAVNKDRKDKEPLIRNNISNKSSAFIHDVDNTDADSKENKNNTEPKEQYINILNESGINDFKSSGDENDDSVAITTPQVSNESGIINDFKSSGEEYVNSLAITTPQGSNESGITDVFKSNVEEYDNSLAINTPQVSNESGIINDLKSCGESQVLNESGKLIDFKSSSEKYDNSLGITTSQADKIFVLSNDSADCSDHETLITLDQIGYDDNIGKIQITNIKCDPHKKEDTTNDVTKKSVTNTEIKQDILKCKNAPKESSYIEPKQNVSLEINNSNIGKNVKVEDDNVKLKFLKQLSASEKLFLKQLETRMLSFLHEEYEITSIIKKGKFSAIFKCVNSKREDFAVKVLNVNYDQIGVQKKMLWGLQKSTSSHNSKIIHMMNSFNMNGYWCLLLEYYPKNLEEALRESSKSFHINLVQVLARQLIAATTMLANNNIVHTDIKPRHILLNSNNGKLKLAGFDQSTYIQHLQITTSTSTVNYRAPEIILGFTADFRIDVWSTAVVIFEMATGRKLFPGVFNNEILYKQMCIMGNMPHDMIMNSSRSDYYFIGTGFRRRMGPMGQQIRLIYNFERQGLRCALLNAYQWDWERFANRREVHADKAKLSHLNELLDQMLVLDPRYRLPINFVGVNPL